MKNKDEIKTLAKEIESCRKTLTALGDETRQHLIIQMMLAGDDCSGMRVPEITELTSLSRPAVSHHLQILKDAGIVRVRKEGTMNYYYFDSDNSISDLISMLEHADRIIHALPDRSGD